MSTIDIETIRTLERVLGEIRTALIARRASIEETRDELVRSYPHDRQRAAQVDVEATGAVDATRWALQLVDRKIEAVRLSYDGR